MLLPGSGSDEVFVAAAFGPPLRALGWTVRTPAPRPGPGVVDGYFTAFDAAAASARRRGVPLVVGGVSLGAQVAVRWAGRRRERGEPGPDGLLLALPAWTGAPGPAPAALAAATSADAVARDGLDATLAQVRASAPAWLADELDRAWTRYGDALAASLRAAAAGPGPTETQLAGLTVPVALVGLVDDPLHPLAVARHWRRLIPRAALVATSLAELGRDRTVLGTAAARAWRELGAASPAGGVGPAWSPGAAGPG